MAIVCETEKGWLVDHKQALDRAYTSTVPKLVVDSDSNNQLTVAKRYESLPELFEIHVPFMMDSQFFKSYPASSGQSYEISTQTDFKKKRSRKRKAPLNSGEEAALAYHQQVKEIIHTAYQQLLSLGRGTGYFSETKHPGAVENNTSARRVAAAAGAGDSLRQQSCAIKDQEVCCTTPTDLSLTSDGDELPTLHNKLFENSSACSYVLQHGGHSYIIPPKCKFVMSDIKQITLVGKGKYDVIVIDPPWQNKSVKRLKSYQWLSNEDLLQLPVPNLATRGSLIVVWVTNRKQQHAFVTDELFPAWGVKNHVQWYWLKVTKRGEPVYDIDSQHKKPYESIMLGRVQDSETSTCCHLPPDNKVIVSIPSSLHSSKPPLTDLLKPYIEKDAHCLELFARNLLPGWTSWGNEVLKLQHMDYWKKVETTTVNTDIKDS